MTSAATPCSSKTLVVPAGEMDDPQRNVPRALFIVMAIVTTVYIAVFGVAVGTFPGIAGHDNPVAASSALFLGPAGGTLIAVGIILSVFGSSELSLLLFESLLDQPFRRLQFASMSHFAFQLPFKSLEIGG